MREITSKLGLLVLLFSVGNVSAETLKFSYWDDAKPPFVIEHDGVVHSGIIKDLADQISSEAGLQAEFVKLPVLRIEQQLQSGDIDVDCLTSPIWKELPSSYHWSPVLFDGADRFLVRPELSLKLHSYNDLKGTTLGIYNGYVYHPEVMSLIKSGDVATIKLKGLEHGIHLLQLKRLDVLIDFGILLKYQLRERKLNEQLVLAKLPADEYKLHCAYSKQIKNKIAPKTLDMLIENLVRTGELDRILKRYQ
ncbi:MULTISPECIES: ABC transporter substrate-binding protein [unclassified Oleiphilus]|jgi:ABC-type amino acid transport substrate-binding protein|uniref:substrate-binding periplasmic protein n=7 Tax=Oleiphilus TaxID=141450 RepID=UPI0007C3626C|nr:MULTISPECIES: transporter substrate-binding domain-containing protein [unclassified Oleiphilus]KZY75774.1 hypothetical protein A3740_02290 [Oleiphilus sp. HI0068]KZY78610.1 hypothetical protein A3741_01045 [Oleiphilus sp. HI0069]KZY86907.1 hypothetical protein A3743_15880 [Oleiphilus sp. HI0072]KZZ20899.1 hypothetical protein A3749_02970 [Oleiphilus sp. HI0078]KZY29786.1 hypothetical protein A3729_01340 [Oleiphilus sp. HI0043]